MAENVIGYLPKTRLESELAEVIDFVYSQNPTSLKIEVNADLDSLPTIHVCLDGIIYQIGESEDE